MMRTVKRVIFFSLLSLLIAGVLPWLVVRIGNILFAGSPGQAGLVWRIAEFTSFYDRDVVLYDIGNAQYKERELDAAISTYQSADAIAQPKTLCPIRFNWALSLMEKGDATQSRDEARNAYSEGLRVVSINYCQNDPAYKERFEALYNELLARLKGADEPSEEPSEQPQDGDTEEAEEVIKDNQSEKSSARDYQNLRRYYSERGGSGSGSQSEFVW